MLQNHWFGYFPLKQVRKTVSCALTENFAVIAGTENGIEGEIEILLLNNGIPVDSVQGRKKFCLSIVI